MNDFLGLLRYHTYDGDLAYLYLAKNNANQEAKRKRGHHHDDNSDSQFDDIGEDVFTGCQLPFKDVSSELKVWQAVD